jgi:CheY-like chemotaxis protein/anti-sigma regulatory factor (Ser/Thr protein kinase)
VAVTAPPAESTYVRADRQRLKQVLLNLASNAVKYNRENGSIRFSCASVSDGRVRIAVTDSGPGLTEAQIDRMFVPFERLGAELTGVEGTGIGLALSLRLAEAMGGTLEVESKPGEGATFTVDLPAAQDPFDAFSPDRAAWAQPALVEPASGGVLYIEDNPSNLRLVERILAQRGRIRLVTSTQGGQGIELARRHRPDLILLDLHLPDLAGDKVLRQLRADPATVHIPVVMLSADATPGQIDRLLAAGAQHYLTKPIDVGQLLALLDHTLAATKP